MLSIGKLTAAQTQYYEQQVARGRDDYYIGRGESPGRWTGAGAAALALDGEVAADGFAALMAGFDPQTGEELVRRGKRSTVAALDLTFSAPKSVSVLYAIGGEATSAALVEAHEEAVAAALGYLEREACVVRRGHGGRDRRTAAGFVSAAYRHRMSRAQDPQLHTHVVTANLARGPDGRWTALHATPIYEHAKAAGFLYQAHLRAAVRERLPWVEWGPVRNGMAEMVGVPYEVLREFSTRRRVIEEREAELVAAGVTVGDAGREAIAHDTRVAKRYQVSTEEWRARVRSRAAEHGLGTRELDELAGRAPAPASTSAEDIEATESARLLGPRGVTELRNTFAGHDAVMALAAAHAQGAHAHRVEGAVRRLLQSPTVRGVPDARGARWTTNELLAHEQAIVRGAERRRAERTGLVDAALVERVLGALPTPLSTEQARAVRTLTSSGRGVDSVEALAGTGKTYSAGVLARVYEAAGYRVSATAPTGRAARELKEQAGITASSTLTRLRMDLEEDPAGFGRGRAVLIIDEAGMAGTRDSAFVLAAAERQHVKVVAIGDSGQLSSVQAGGWLGSLTRRFGSLDLREVMRQRDPRERMLLARVHRGEPDAYLAHKQAAGQLQWFAGEDAGAGGEAAAVTRWWERQADIEWGSAVLVCRDNERRGRLNAGARELAAAHGRLGEDVEIGGRLWAVGDRVIARQNDRLLDVDNGTRGTITAIDTGRGTLTVRTDAGPARTLDVTYVGEHLEHAYALTGHGMQGGTVEWAGVLGAPHELSRNWSYTALSRGREPTDVYVVDVAPHRHTAREEIAPGSEGAGERAGLPELAAAMRRRDDEDLALDRLNFAEPMTRPEPRDEPVQEAGAEAHHSAPSPRYATSTTRELGDRLATLERSIGRYPQHLADQLDRLRDEIARTEAIAEAARAQLREPEPAARRVPQRGTPEDLAAIARERARAAAADQHLSMLRREERDLAANIPDREAWSAERAPMLEEASELRAEIASRREEHLARALAAPASHLTAALAARPSTAREARAWDTAARVIETYRFDHQHSGPDALGERPHEAQKRRAWQRARHELERAQRVLARSARPHPGDGRSR